MIRATLFITALFAGACYDPTIAEKPGFTCSEEDNPACPNGYSCVNGRCVTKSQSGEALVIDIPKTGESYNGMHNDPGLNDASRCPDFKLEPNDDLGSAVPADAPADVTTEYLKSLAICPQSGTRPDIDLFVVDLTGATQDVTLMAEVTYQIASGDLDLAILNSAGEIIASDGTAISNGCTVAAAPPGVYYVAVQGAAGQVNRYEMRARSFSMPQACPKDAAPPSM